MEVLRGLRLPLFQGRVNKYRLMSVFKMFSYIPGAKLREGWKSPPGPHRHSSPSSETSQLLKCAWRREEAGEAGWCQVGERMVVGMEGA